MIALEITMLLVALAMLAAIGRIAWGPTAADRVIAADLLMFAIIAQIALVGVRSARTGTFDLVLVATLVAFLAGASFGRALGRGRR